MTNRIKKEDDFFFFWGGFFSQWYKTPIGMKLTKDSKIIMFNCAEQAMMWGKAIFFEDEETANQILKTSSPKEQKALGRKVKNFNQEKWDKFKYKLVLRINYLKFMQNPELKELLLLTDNKEIVEASPYDTIWGVGLAESDPLILDKTKWQGENLLGKALMEVRQTIRNKDKSCLE